MRENAHALDDLRSAFLHQPIVSGDIRFALGRINNQRFDFIAAAAQFTAGREACTA